MKITSSAFSHNQNIPSKYTCDGGNISPPLSIGEVPATAKSLVLIVDDPDAPGGDFSHWLVWNIDLQIEEIGEGGVLAGSVSGTNDFGKTGYGGPCPPGGTHRYFFKIYALDTTLDIPAKSEKQELLNAISPHILDQGELIGLYGR
ncbi:hypothetical protein A2781_05075 [Candidatus Gottesmanbacteria bacterium RIFCSPHIGHO2_01_FULL_42_27]|uniref:Phosphatidylethanolamine-binding protein n=1 Tax=Candidatus Gottesmanbacteria bacterium RIFCSPLOWO2_01_FULL_42_22 TaxID=1798391 RepID=A0A1F6BKD2_9BACT|nr:MAG: hypothetical protein A2781_05075 [Candidatus Gottesmanbacteria bacterium RIFCSPHIGHO2_01_FULL_42_27]OGG20733.1 MAG: hypothetical protein A3E72_05985 [Candidatus Gottesmanbacteria bacterium RIFCSPHIGHO2_12_FULL_43_26]OGG33365.1 MAG: hypothetical protein A3G68_00475 [Candidatus Gottesmanbacteria bacterium RIFCSPLOWO2_12_FULL_42_10]OGG36987.1 MAG: hypothetical protein A2968_01775 [Candidatus Gottesmanbacteria bacterium RIFCSPLOWO2_01_FULL_42_22]